MRPYRFADEWLLPASTSEVFEAVTDLANYSLWWSNVLSVRQLEEDVAEMVCRAALPYQLVIRMHRREQNERTGELRVEISGDLQGFLAGKLLSVTSGTQLLITQEVEVHKNSLRRLDFIARPLFRANHSAMMRRGCKGLICYL